ncbi:hypothetical protein [Streptococcus dentiloxodontae]
MKKVLTLGLLSLSLLTIAACSNQSKSGSASNASASSSQKQKISYDDKGLPTVLKTSYTGSSSSHADENDSYGGFLLEDNGSGTITFDKEKLTIIDNEPRTIEAAPFAVLKEDDLTATDKGKFNQYKSLTEGNPYFIMLTQNDDSEITDEAIENYKNGESTPFIYIVILEDNGNKIRIIELPNEGSTEDASTLDFTGEAD